MWEIKAVNNPDFGEPRTAMTDWDFDMDASTFTVYDTWTHKFALDTFDSNTSRVLNRSYDNLNAAYLGFDHEYSGADQITVAGWDPQAQTGGVTVYAGSYTTD